VLFLKQSDARGWKLFDSNSGTITFSSAAVWSSVPAGTLLVAYNGSNRDTIVPADDTDASDGVWSSRTTTPPISRAIDALGNGGDSISLSDASSTLIDGVCYGNNASQTPQLGSVSGNTAAATRTTPKRVLTLRQLANPRRQQRHACGRQRSGQLQLVAQIRSGALATRNSALASAARLCPPFDRSNTGLISGSVGSDGFFTIVIERTSRQPRRTAVQPAGG